MRRHRPDDEVDFDVAAVDAEVEDARRLPPKPRPAAKARTPGTSGGPSRPEPDDPAGSRAAIAFRTCPRCRRCSLRPARSPACASAWDASRTTRDGPGRHVGLVSVPHGAKTYLAATLAQGADRGAPGLDRPGRGDRRPRGGGAGRLAGRPGCSRRPRAADRAGLRTQRADRRRDRRPGRGAGRVAERAGADPRGRRPVAPPAHDRPGRPPARPARAAGRIATPPGRAAARAVRSRVRAGQRSRRPGRVGAPRRDRRRLPAIDGAPDPDRVLRRRDRLVALVRPDRPADDDRDRERGPAARLRVPPAGGWRGRDPRPTRPRGRATPGTSRRGPRPLRHRAAAGRRGRRGEPGDGRR